MALTVFKCASCFHANKADDGEPCYWCGGLDRLTLQPVRVPNQQQGTPSYDDMLVEMEREEANRYTEVSIEDQVKALIAKYFEEREKNERSQHQGTQKAAEI